MQHKPLVDGKTHSLVGPGVSHVRGSTFDGRGGPYCYGYQHGTSSHVEAHRINRPRRSRHHDDDRLHSPPHAPARSSATTATTTRARSWSKRGSGGSTWCSARAAPFAIRWRSAALA